MNQAQKAAEYHQKGYNCAQPIVCAFCDKVGLDEKTAFIFLQHRSLTFCYKRK